MLSFLKYAVSVNIFEVRSDSNDRNFKVFTVLDKYDSFVVDVPFLRFKKGIRYYFDV